MQDKERNLESETTSMDGGIEGQTSGHSTLERQGIQYQSNIRTHPNSLGKSLNLHMVGGKTGFFAVFKKNDAFHPFFLRASQ